MGCTAILLASTRRRSRGGQDALNASARQALTRVAAAIRRFPDEKILIEGHTDSVGDQTISVKGECICEQRP